MHTFRYTGHKNTDYRIDSCLNSKDTHILSGSEDGQVYIWDLIEVNQDIYRGGGVKKFVESALIIALL